MIRRASSSGEREGSASSGSPQTLRYEPLASRTKKPGKIDDPAAYLVTAIRNSHAAPKNYIPRAERERQAEAKRQQEQKAAEDAAAREGARRIDRQDRDVLPAADQVEPERLDERALPDARNAADPHARRPPGGGQEQLE